MILLRDYSGLDGKLLLSEVGDVIYIYFQGLFVFIEMIFNGFWRVGVDLLQWRFSARSVFLQYEGLSVPVC